MDAFFEFFNTYNNMTPVLLPWFILLIALYAVIQLFLVSGVLSVFLNPRRYHAAWFGQQCIAFFPRMVKLALWSLPILILLMLLPELLNLLKRALFGQDPYQYIDYWTIRLVMLTRMGALLVYYLIFDYAAIHLLRHEAGNALRALTFSMRLHARFFLRTSGFALLVVTAGLAALPVYYSLATLLRSGRIAAVILLFLLQQAFMILRAFLKLVRYSGQISLYRQLDSMLTPAPETLQVATPDQQTPMTL